MAKVGKARQIGYLEQFFPFPLTNRDAIVYGFGVNRFHNKGSLTVIAKSLSLVDDPNIQALANLAD